MAVEKQDNVQFRILYFIGIILIVANHCGGGSISLVYEWFPAYSFHLALFVFASGYFFINNREKSIGKFIKKVILKFLVPLYVWNLIYGLIVLIVHQFGIELGKNLSINTLLIMPIYNGHQFVFNLASWFIFPLLVIQLLNIFAIKLIGKKDKLYYLHFIISLALGFLGVTLAINGYNKDFLLLLTRVLYFIPFFSLGLLYRTNLEKYDKCSNALYFAMLFTIALIFIYLVGGTKSYMPSWCTRFDNFYNPFIAGILGICFWLRISKVLVPSLKDSKIVQVISKNTFSIMMHHLMGFFLLNTLWLALSKVFSFIEGFKYDSYKTDIYYRYLPNRLIQFNLLYVVVGIAFSLLVAYISKIIVQFIKNKITHKDV